MVGSGRCRISLRDAVVMWGHTGGVVVLLLNHRLTSGNPSGSGGGRRRRCDYWWVNQWRPVSWFAEVAVFADRGSMPLLDPALQIKEAGTFET